MRGRWVAAVNVSRNGFGGIAMEFWGRPMRRPDGWSRGWDTAPVIMKRSGRRKLVPALDIGAPVLMLHLPSRRAAEPPSRRAAEPPSRGHECVRRVAALASPSVLPA